MSNSKAALTCMPRQIEAVASWAVCVRPFRGWKYYRVSLIATCCAHNCRENRQNDRAGCKIGRNGTPHTSHTHISSLVCTDPKPNNSTRTHITTLVIGPLVICTSLRRLGKAHGINIKNKAVKTSENIPWIKSSVDLINVKVNPCLRLH